ncbi:MAG: glycosyltransferase family 9 protein [Parvibaculales bacterium]
MASSAQEKILIIKLGAFGDVMMSDGAFRDIRAHHKNAHISVLTTPPYRKIMQACPHIDDVIIDPRAPRWKLWTLLKVKKQLQAHDFTMVYDLQDNARTKLYFKWMTQVQKWSGTQKQASHRYTENAPKTIPALDRMAGQLQAAGIDVQHTGVPDLSWMGQGLSPEIEALLAAQNIQPGFVLLIPGASKRHPQKRWPHYDALADWLQEKGHQVVTAPGPDELDLCAKMPATMLMDSTKPLNFFQLAALIPYCGFVIGNDTGPTHLAAHTGKSKGLALFGPHTSAKLTCVDRKFDIIECADLNQLELQTVTNKLTELLPSH